MSDNKMKCILRHKFLYRICIRNGTNHSIFTIEKTKYTLITPTVRQFALLIKMQLPVYTVGGGWGSLVSMDFLNCFKGSMIACYMFVYDMFIGLFQDTTLL